MWVSLTDLALNAQDPVWKALHDVMGCNAKKLEAADLPSPL